MPTSILDFKILDQMICELAKQRWSLSDQVLGSKTWLELKSWGQAKRELGGFKAAEMGRGSERQLNSEMRGDSTFWLEKTDWPEGFAALETLREHLNQNLFLGLQSFECHLACYPPGARYARHLDQPRSSQSLLGERVITFVYYLNENWTAADGGEIYFPDLDLKVLPLGGRLVLFESQALEHEVLPARRERWSLTGWMRRSRL